MIGSPSFSKDTSIAGNYRYVVIAGPTASGKSSLAHKLALAWDGEIINCDSVQLYQGLSIGAAKPSSEERAELRYHLLDRLAPTESYDARKFAEEAKALIAEIRSRKRIPIVVGGTGLYLRALWNENWHDLPKDDNIRLQLAEKSNAELYAELQQLDPARASQIHVNDRYRLLRAVELCRILGGPVFQGKRPAQSTRQEAFAIKMELERSHLHERIAFRAKEMLQKGFIAEVKGLLQAGWPQDAKALQSIGYAQVLEFLNGRYDETELLKQIIYATRQYAKRQETWFRKVDFDFYWRSPQDTDFLYEKLASQTLCFFPPSAES